MARPVESESAISCLQCDCWVETVNIPAYVSQAFLEAAHAHVQHALEVVQRQRIYSENYVEPERLAPPTPPAENARATAARRDPGIQIGFLDRSRPDHRGKEERRKITSRVRRGGFLQGKKVPLPHSYTDVIIVTNICS